jgi:CRP-like cAMP-binding protein
VYTTFYKRLCENPALILKFPDLQKHVHMIDPSSDLFNLQNYIEDVLRRTPENRSCSHVEILDYLLESVPFKKRFCQGWPSQKMQMLWKSSKIIKYDAMMSIFEKDVQAIYIYILLTGVVRTMHHSRMRKDQAKSIEHFPKEIFGDEAVLGLPTRKSSAKALLKCSLLAINKKDFFSLSGKEHFVEGRVLLLSTFPIFQDLEAGKLHRLASKCHEMQFSRGQTVVAQGKCASAMYFVKSGRLVWKRRSKKQNRVVASISERDFFGESCCLSQQSKRGVREMCDVVAESQKVEVLMLPEEICRKFDQGIFDVIEETFLLRQQWHKERLGHMINNPITKVSLKLKGTTPHATETSSKEALNKNNPHNPEKQRTDLSNLIRSPCSNRQDASPINWADTQSTAFKRSRTGMNIQKIDMEVSVTTTSFTSLSLKTHLEQTTGPSNGRSLEQHQIPCFSTFLMPSRVQNMLRQDAREVQPQPTRSPSDIDRSVPKKIKAKFKKKPVQLDLKLIDSSHSQSAPPTLQVSTKAWASPTNVQIESVQSAPWITKNFPTCSPIAARTAAHHW